MEDKIRTVCVEKTVAKAILIFVGSTQNNASESPMSKLKELHTAYGLKGLKVFGVVIDNQEGLTDRQSVLNSAFGLKGVLDLPFQVLSDPASQVTKPLRGSGEPPLTLLLDSAKVIRFKQVGADPDFERLKGYIETLLK